MKEELRATPFLPDQKARYLVEWEEGFHPKSGIGFLHYLKPMEVEPDLVSLKNLM